jgi:hypothetical protein
VLLELEVSVLLVLALPLSEFEPEYVALVPLEGVDELFRLLLLLVDALGVELEDWFQAAFVLALLLLAALALTPEEEDVSLEMAEDWPTVVVVVVSLAAVLEDLVLLLQPLRANPARIKVNNIEFFIGGLSCGPTDRPSSDRF